MYKFIGFAEDVAEGDNVPFENLGKETVDVKVKKAGKGVKISDEAILSAYGNPVDEIAKQLLMSIAGKVDNDCVEAFRTAKKNVAADAFDKYVISDMLGRIDAIIDGEDCEVGVESTIVDASGEIPVLLRPGGITLEDLREVVPETKVDEHILTSVKQGEQPLCPGMKYKHYAPDAEVTVVEGDMKSVKAKIDELLKANHDKVCGVLTMSENAYDSAIILSGGITNKEYARNLFSNLREFDNLGVDVVFAEFESRDGYGLAIKNRLYKSASQRVIYV